MISCNASKKLTKLNLGCGLQAPAGWVNIDASFTARLSRVKMLYKLICKFVGLKEISWPKNIKVIDVRKGLPFENGSVNAIFSSHMLEHMSYKDADFVIGECFRVLGNSGIIRILVPDLYQLAKKYVQFIDIEPKGEHSHNFLKALNAFDNEPHKGIVRLFGKIFSHSKHLYMYDPWSLREVLEKHGFKKISKMDYGNSCISDIKLLEDKDRYENAFCLEGIKELM
jgi:SAM-dependent methyltransferase